MFGLRQWPSPQCTEKKNIPSFVRSGLTVAAGQMQLGKSDVEQDLFASAALQLPYEHCDDVSVIPVRSNKCR